MSVLQFARVRKQPKEKSVREITIESYLVRECTRAGARAHKLRGRGWPDRLILWPHAFATDFIETKRPKGGRYQPLQLKIHTELRNLGYYVGVLRTKLEVDNYVLMRRTNLGAHNKVHGSKAAHARRPKRVSA